MDLIKHYINGADIDGGSRQGDVYNPAIGEVVSKVTLGDLEVVNNAIESSKKVLEKWRYTTPAKRASIMFNYKKLLEDNSARIAEMVSKEHGKTIEDAKGSLQRGIEVVEYACGIPNLLKGEYSNQVGSGIDTFSMKQELGICAGITPFNFPVMIPLWMFPLATACGNAFILKPSERDPSSSIELVRLFEEAGAPPGLVNVVNGDKEVVDAIKSKTKEMAGMQVPVKIKIDDKKGFTIDIGTPPASSLIKQVLDLEKGSGEAGTVVAADMTLEQAITVAKQKGPGLTGGDIKAMTSEILGVAKSMGLSCEGKDPKEIQASIKSGSLDDRF